MKQSISIYRHFILCIILLVAVTNIIEEEPTQVQHSGKGFSRKIGHHSIETFKLKFK